MLYEVITGQTDRLPGIVRPGPRDDRYLPAHRLDHAVDHPLVLIEGERGRLSRGAAGDDAVGPALDLELHQLLQRRHVQLPVPELV